MTCYDEGRLMAYLDGQLPPAESGALDAHLRTCAVCREELDRLAAERAEAGRLLDRYHQAAGNVRVSVPPFRPGPAGPKTPRKGAVDWMRRYYKWIAAAAAAAAAVVLLFSFDPARSVAAQFLNVFRVERVQVLHFDPKDIAALETALRNQAGEVSIANFGRVEAEPLPDSGHSPESVPEAVGEYILAGEARLQPGRVVEIAPDVAGINDFLRSLGSTTLMPAEIDGRTFTITIPDCLHAVYRHQATGAHLGVIRQAAPTLEVPPEVPVAAVRRALLDLPVLPPDLKRTLEGVHDWTRTLPFPDFSGRAVEITFDGAPGLFIQGGEYPRHQDCPV
ncbi:MAG: zf-HC2 domain-containing protein, partial [Candidatus Desulforudis sp.]|nr:zf-HC2 domain-containing protein [Desulforudis sp.]